MSTLGGVAHPDQLDAEPSPRHVALEALRALHAEQRHLDLRRIEVRVALAEQRATVARIEADAGHRRQGPVEERVHEHACFAAARLAVEARRIDQRLLVLDRELRVAQVRAIAAAARR